MTTLAEQRNGIESRAHKSKQETCSRKTARRCPITSSDLCDRLETSKLAELKAIFLLLKSANEQANRKLEVAREALECAKYALQNPASDLIFAIDACDSALTLLSDSTEVKP